MILFGGAPQIPKSGNPVMLSSMVITLKSASVVVQCVFGVRRAEREQNSRRSERLPSLDVKIDGIGNKFPFSLRAKTDLQFSVKLEHALCQQDPEDRLPLSLKENLVLVEAKRAPGKSIPWITGISAPGTSVFASVESLDPRSDLHL